MYAPGTVAPRRVVTLAAPVAVAPVVAPITGPRPMGVPPDERAPMPYPSSVAAQAQAPGTVAPVMPRPVPAAIAATRGGQPANPVQQVAAVTAPIAYAMQQYKEHGNPWTAAAEGFTNASSYNEGQAQDQAKREEAAQLLKDSPDLQQQVADGTIDLPSALTIAQQRTSTAAASDRKTKIIGYLQQSGDKDIADQYANGVLDEDGVAKALEAKDKTTNPTATDDQKELAQINDERKQAGQDPMTMEEFLGKKKSGFGTDAGALIDGLPQVQLDDKGLPDPQGQQAFMDQLDPQTANLVKGVANYEMDITKVTSLKGGERQQLAALVKQYDPTFDMTQYTARAKMRTSITSGNYAQALNSANTLIGHMDTLKAAAKDLHNQGGLLTPWNNVANATKQTFGDPATTKFNEAKKAVASELAKVFKGTGVATEGEIEEWQSSFDANNSPEQIDAAIKQGIELLKSRIDTVQTQFKSTMGKPMDFSFLTPHARKVLVDLGFDTSYLDPVSGSGDQPDFAGADKPDGSAPAADAAPAKEDAPPVLDPASDVGKSAWASLPDGATYTVPGDDTVYVKQSKK